MKQTVAIAALLGNISAINLLKHQKRQHVDNVANIEKTWSRDTIQDNMMPKEVSSLQLNR
jgi:hypothetical protein